MGPQPSMMPTTMGKDLEKLGEKLKHKIKGATFMCLVMTE